MPHTSAQPVVRHAARVVVLDPNERILMLKCKSGNPGDADHFWITPGGGLDEGETHVDAAVRELREELGYTFPDGTGPDALGPHIWSRVHTFPWLGRLLQQHERFFLHRLPRPIDVIDHHQTEEELNFLLGHRWWSVDELAASSERFAPRGIAALLARLLTEGPPDEPMQIEV